eukprot:1146731-Pelagomonas_calceolata.AAC.3
MQEAEGGGDGAPDGLPVLFLFVSGCGAGGGCWCARRWENAKTACIINMATCTCLFCFGQEVEPEEGAGGPADGDGAAAGPGPGAEGVPLGGVARVDGEGDEVMDGGGAAEVAEAEALDLQNDTCDVGLACEMVWRRQMSALSTASHKPVLSGS